MGVGTVLIDREVVKNILEHVDGICLKYKKSTQKPKPVQEVDLTRADTIPVLTSEVPTQKPVHHSTTLPRADTIPVLTSELHRPVHRTTSLPGIQSPATMSPPLTDSQERLLMETIGATPKKGIKRPRRQSTSADQDSTV